MRTISGSRGLKRIACEALDGIVWFAAPDSQEAAEVPGSREVRIEQRRPIEQHDAAIEIADEMRERRPQARSTLRL
jgi:hypothetical protein